MDSKELIPPAYVARRADTPKRVVVPARETIPVAPFWRTRLLKRSFRLSKKLHHNSAAKKITCIFNLTKRFFTKCINCRKNLFYEIL
jgi:hypothetical protein